MTMATIPNENNFENIKNDLLPLSFIFVSNFRIKCQRLAAPPAKMNYSNTRLQRNILISRICVCFYFILSKFTLFKQIGKYTMDLLKS